MEKLKNVIEEQLKLMERFGLTAEENLVVELLFLCIEGRCTDLIVRYYNLPITKTGLGKVLISLQDKGVILKSCKFKEGSEFDPDTIAFNENFLKFYRKTSGELGMELYKAYPNEVVIQGQCITLKNWGKKFNTEEEMYYRYGKSIGWNLAKHQHVLELIQWSKEHDLFGLNINIADFIISKMWESIEEHRDGSNSITYDTVTLV